MQLSSAEKAPFVKIVYYGPGLSGKTTNVESIHRLTDPGRKQPMVSLKTDGDRTLFFDLLPFDLGTMFGLSIRLKVFTVPGQIQYDTTRKQVLAGADGVVFVADSSPGRADANERMIKYLKANLAANGLDAETIPIVFQWNKRDLPDAIDAATLDRSLNWRGASAYEGIATVGNGVIETFREIATATLESVVAKATSLGRAADASTIRERVGAQLDPFVFDPNREPGEETQGESQTLGTVHDQARAIRSTGDGHHREVLGLDALLQEAVQANMEMGDRLVGAGGPDVLLARARRERKAIARLIQIARLSPAPEAILKMTLTAALAGLDRTVGSVVTLAGDGSPLE